MSIENANYIDGLDPTLPRKSDNIDEGDDHLRLLKSAIKATFPGVNGQGYETPILANEIDLNYCTGIVSNVQAQINLLNSGGGGLEERIKENEDDIVLLQADIVAGDIRLSVLEGRMTDTETQTAFNKSASAQNTLDISDLSSFVDSINDEVNLLKGNLTAPVGTQLLFAAGNIPAGWSLFNIGTTRMIRLLPVNVSGNGGTDDPITISSTPWEPRYTDTVVATKV